MSWGRETLWKNIPNIGTYLSNHHNTTICNLPPCKHSLNPPLEHPPNHPTRTLYYFGHYSFFDIKRAQTLCLFIYLCRLDIFNLLLPTNLLHMKNALYTHPSPLAKNKHHSIFPPIFLWKLKKTFVTLIKKPFSYCKKLIS